MRNRLRSGLPGIVLWALIGPSLALAQAQTAPAPFTPPEDIHFRTANIMSEGTRMAAELFSLKALDGKKLPTVILCHGWGGTARDLRPEGIAFARAGFLAVAIDYRGWGASDARLVLAAPAPANRSGTRFTAEVKEVHNDRIRLLRSVSSEDDGILYAAEDGG